MAPTSAPAPDSSNQAPVQNTGLSEPRQRQITRLCANTALVLMQHGAESALVESLTRRLGLSLGVDQVQVAIMANALTITTLSEKHCITTVRRNEDRGINMQVVTEVQKAVLKVEDKELSAEAYDEALHSLQPLRYPRMLTTLAIGLSCACFAGLAGADVVSCAVAFVASSFAMNLRLFLAARHFNPLITFFAAAFVATLLASVGALCGLGGEPRIAMASSVLLLVPGFPLINGFSDMVKGYINTGISRLMYGTLLAAATCAGILLAMSILHIGPWFDTVSNLPIPTASSAAAIANMGFILALLLKMVLAAVPAVGFGLAFHVPAAVLRFCALGGALGYGLRFVLRETGMPIEWATLIAALTVSLIGIQIAQRLRAHPKVFTVAAMIPMVPGVPFFTSLLAFIQIHQKGYTVELFATATNAGARALFVTGALAVGLALPGLLFYRGRPVV